eukprot:scaffold59978_cov61-Phaeocystis_antarctica.AAC.3
MLERHLQGWVRSLPPQAPHRLGRLLSVGWRCEDQLHLIVGRQAPLDAHVLKGARVLEARGRVGREGLLNSQSRCRQQQHDQRLHWADPSYKRYKHVFNMVNL